MCLPRTTPGTHHDDVYLTACACIYRLTLAVLALACAAGAATAESAPVAKTNLPMLKAWTGDLDGMKSRRVDPYSRSLQQDDLLHRQG